jgi:FkbM family methyltransferase
VTLGHWIRVIRTHPRPLRLMAARVLQHTGLSRVFTIKLDGYALRFYPTNLSANLWINTESRFHDLSLFKQYCRPGDTIIDVGANIGEISIICSQRVGAGGRVFAFEPHPRIYRFLIGNLAFNHCTNVSARNVALGETNAHLRMSDGKRDDMNRIDASGTIAIAVTTLDSEVPASPIALLKVDVEGAELSVLKGAMRTLELAACVNCELIEAHCERYGHHMGDVIAFLQQAGLSTYRLADAHRLEAIDATFRDPGAHELVALRDPADFIARTGWQIAS